MKVTDASAIVNALYKEMTGATDIAVVDASNIVDIGKTLQKVTSVDSIYKSIADKVGKVVVKNKLYTGKFPNLLRDGWEFGSIMETLRVKPYTAVNDPSHNPSNGSYPLTDYQAGGVVAKYFTDYDNFEFVYWKPTDQLWSAFNSMDEMVRFLGAIEVAVANSLTVRLQGLAKTAINNMIAQTIHADFPNTASENYNANSYARSINVLKLYNDATGSSLTVENCRQSAEFLKFFVKLVMNTYDRLQDMSKIFNIDGEDTFTKAEDINLVVLSTVANDIKVNMQSDVYHKDLVSLPNYETVPYWQASGTSYDESVIGEIKVTIKTGDETTATVELPGILGVMFDKNAIGINCEKRKTTTFYHPDLDQTKFFDKYFAQYYNDFSENFVVFYVA